MPPNSLPGRRSSPTPSPLDGDACPRLASGVAFEPVADDGRWMAMLHGVPSSRVSSGVIDLLRAMNGETPLHDLHRRFAAPEPFESFAQLVERFRAAGLLEGEAKLPPGRVSYRPPFTMQIATLQAPAIFHRLGRLVVPFSRRSALISMALLLSVGLIAAILQADELLDVLSTPVPLSGLVCLVVSLALMTLLHESAHGITLTRFGGRPRRAGFMLFYLSPAFFVDVTDGWRLPDRRQRVEIALAGPATHAGVGAIALAAALVVPQPLVHETLLLFAASCAAIVLVNLIPFVRFDGYIALMSALDEPNLRSRTIRDGSDFLLRLLFGGQPTSKRMNAWWSVPFGLACLIAPAVLVVFAVARIGRALAGGGPVLGILVVALEAAVVLTGLVLLAKALRRALRSGVGRLRFGIVLSALVASAVMTGAAIPVPVTAAFGFVAQGGRVMLIQAGETVDARLPEGAPVVLMSNGILANQQLGRGTVRPQGPDAKTVPLDVLFPVTAKGVSVPAVVVARVDVSEKRGSLPSTGQARVELGVRNLWQTLWSVGVELPLSSLQSGEMGKE